MTDRERVLVNKVCDLSIEAIDKITQLKQENSKLKQQVAELKKPKKKRNFRAMTVGEHCEYMRSRRTRCRDCEYFRNLYYCDYSKFNEVQDGKEPYKTKDGKYVFVEVKSC